MAGAYPGFCSMKQLRVLLPPPPPPPVVLGYRQQYVANYPFYTPGWGETVQIKVLV